MTQTAQLSISPTQDWSKLDFTHKLLLYPTETLWAIGCAMDDIITIERINSIKQRKNKAYLMLATDFSQIKHYIEPLEPQVLETLAQLKSAPLSLAFPSQHPLLSSINPHGSSLAFRVSTDPVIKKIITKIKAPLISTSANFSQEKAPADFDAIYLQIKEKVDIIIQKDLQQKLRAQASSLLEYKGAFTLLMLRQGQYDFEQIRTELPSHWTLIRKA